MRKRIGTICVILGVACLLGAICLVGYNHWEAEKASEASEALLQNVQEIINVQNIPHNPNEMPTVKVDGEDCIGVLSIPVLELELPVLTNWSYAKLKKAPCHYFGSYFEKDFVIAAHNYKSHFKRLKELQVGDKVMFTDAGGTSHCYEVVLLETLPPNATEEMIASGFDLSLYTCTSGGGSRITVRCKGI